ncbi:hypothetical protein PENSPDRAFT_648097 [Peniophora sp. CONT]|nr:hypothetical protein PENSPDRAFT_648097 [Peniophora sp. CONT]
MYTVVYIQARLSRPCYRISCTSLLPIPHPVVTTHSFQPLPTPPHLKPYVSTSSAPAGCPSSLTLYLLYTGVMRRCST